MAALPGARLACSGEGGSLSYAELDRLSSRLAGAILSRLGPADPSSQEPVALLLPHSTLICVAVLGVLRSGHFYLPLDPYYGESFIAESLSACPPRLLLAAGSLEPMARAVAGSGTEVLPLEDLLGRVEERFGAAAAGRDTIAAVAFTSGTTGRPRGVIRTHGQIVASAFRFCGYGACSGGRSAFLTSFSQAFGGIALFGSLLTGSTLVVKDPRATDPARLCSWLREERITLLSIAPGTLRALAALDVPPLDDLGAVNTGMEPVARRDIEALCRKLPAGCAIISQLASSETNIAHFVIRNGEAWEGDRIPAGYADDLNAVQVVDEDLRPVPHGALGQILVRSRFMSLGYWQDPEETERRFFRDPVDPSLRVFLTHDLGTMRADGLLEHRGRMDFMVKIRGHRVETAVVEETLTNHPSVAEAAVLAAPARRRCWW